MARYVQHMSGQGNKWKVDSMEEDVWYIKRDPLNLWLPTSEYVEVPAPEVWVDVTHRLVELKDGSFQSRFDDPGVHGCAVYTGEHSPYRLRKSMHNGIACFLVERRTEGGQP